MLDFQFMFGMDKLLHLISFTGVTILIGICILTISGPGGIERHLKMVWFTLVTIGVIEEYRQFLDPGRSTEFLDAVANIAGVSIGTTFTLVLSYIITNKKRIFLNIFRLYPMLLLMLLFGLLYLNERPFIKMDTSFHERLSNFIALIGL
ncbi:VanZ family protein [Mesobacillus subterraneus]|uniref:VanZ family protein n=1 Tax=Mesobacillus subterraneus TaxID=285983 RepID=UPI001CFDA08D|nr:VanZ family protein [Mesobacillus subterraneus]